MKHLIFKMLLFPLMLIGFFSHSLYAVSIYSESFETDGFDTRYVMNRFSDGASGGGNDYFGVVDTNGNTQYITANAVDAFANPMTGLNGTRCVAAEDLKRKDVGDNPLNIVAGTLDAYRGYLVTKTHDVSAYGTVQVKILLGARPSTHETGDNDALRIQYAFDANIATGANNLAPGLPASTDVNTGSYTDIGRFLPTGPLNTSLTQDTNLDGTPDGATLNNTLTEYTFTIPVTGTNLSVRIHMDYDDSAEEVAFDFIRLDGIVPTNTAPSIANLSGDILAYTEGNSVLGIDQGVTAVISDADSANFDGGALVVAIIVNKVSAEDVLSINTMGNVTLSGSTAGSNVSVSGTVVGTLGNTISAGNNLIVNFNANATVARVQEVFDTIGYQNTNTDNPTTATRTVRTTLSDGDGGTSNNIDTTITITAVNDASTIGGSANIVATENGSSAFVSSGFTISDPDSPANFNGATLEFGLDSHPAGESFSIFDNNNNGTAVAFNSSTDDITYAGTVVANATGGSGADLTITFDIDATATAVRDIGRSVVYLISANDDPTTNGSTPTRTISIDFNDGGNTGTGGSLASNQLTETVTITAAQDAPIVTAGNVLAYTEGGAATVIDNTITLSDVDDTQMSSATVTISSGKTTGDLLAVTTANGISGTYDAGTGVLTLNGTATVAQYQAIMRTVTFVNNSDDPTVLSGSRTISWTATDANSDGAGATTSAAVASTINITALSDKPVVTAGGTLNFIDGDAATSIDNSITITDADDTQITGATVTISSGKISDDVLAVATQNGISGTYDAGTGVLTLTGTATVAQYQTALRSVTFNHTSNSPGDANRIITWAVTDANSDGLGAETSDNINSTITSKDIPNITVVSIPNTGMVVGDTVTASITVTSDTEDYTATPNSLSGHIGGFTLSNFTKTNDSTYTAQFTITDGGTDVAAGADIPLSFSIEDAGSNTSAVFSTAIGQAGDALDANRPTFNQAGSSPNDNGVDVSLSNNIVLDFSENVQAGTSGNITLFRASDDSIIEQFAFNSVRLSYSNDKLTIDPTVNLAGSTDFYIQIDAGAVRDMVGSSFAGISDKTIYNFTTIDPNALKTTAAGFDTSNGTNIIGGQTASGIDNTIVVQDETHLSGTSVLDGVGGTNSVSLENANGNGTSFDLTGVATLFNVQTLKALETGTNNITINGSITGPIRGGLITGFVGSGGTENLIVAETDYSLVGKTFTNWESVSLSGAGNSILTVNTATIALINTFGTSDGAGTDEITTAESSLDLTGKTLNNIDLLSILNTSTASFTVNAVLLGSIGGISADGAAQAQVTSNEPSLNLSGEALSNIDKVQNTSSAPNISITLNEATIQDHTTAVEFTNAGSTTTLNVAGSATVDLTGVSLIHVDSVQNTNAGQGFLTLTATQIGSLNTIGSLDIAGDDKLTTNGDFNLTGKTIQNFNTLSSTSITGSIFTLNSTQVGTTSDKLTRFEGSVGGIDIIRVSGTNVDFSSSIMINMDRIESSSTFNVTLSGTTQADTIIMNSGNDTVNGGGGIDTINGGVGNDTISGNAGTDTLTGGAGQDTFSDSASDLDGDIITDFGVLDTIKINGVANAAVMSVSISGGNTTLNIDTTNNSIADTSIILNGELTGTFSAVNNGADSDITYLMSAPDLTAASDSGTSNSDNNTNDNTPTFEGSGVSPNVTVQLFADGVKVGETTANAQGQYTVTSSVLTPGTYTFTIKQVEGAIVSDAGQSLVVTIINANPVADNDTANVIGGQSVDVDVLAGDTDINGDTLSVSTVTDGINGTTSINGDGTVRYTANVLFAGTDTFEYTVSDGHGGSDTATVTVTVASANTAPTSSDVTVIIDEDKSKTFVSADFNFTDANIADTLQSITITALPTVGSLTLSDTDVSLNDVIEVSEIPNLVYTPLANETGAPYDSFDFSVSDGILSSVTYTMTIHVIAVDNALTNFVERFFRDALNRAEEDAQVTEWVEKLTSRQSTAEELAITFLFSDEFKNRNTDDVTFVEILYRILLNRTPDSAGLDSWVSALESGITREALVEQFLHSNEFNIFAHSLDISPVQTQETQIISFVERFYIEILDRASDEAGLNDWVLRLSSQTATAADIARGFVFSDEFKNRAVDNETFVTILYKAFFNRDADLDGFNYWFDKLNQDTSRAEVLNGFLFSLEFSNLANSFGIVAGR